MPDSLNFSNRLVLLILCLFLLSAGKVTGQDANYWSSNYGPGGFLTPGATISNNKDSGVFFYNPALFAYSRKNSASISGTVYQYESTKIANGAGTGLDLKSSGGSVIPQIVSNTITLKLKKPFTIAYALLHENVINFETNQRKDAKFNVLNDSYSPGPEYYIGQYTNQNSISETVGILSTGFKISSRLAAGFSVEGRLRKQTYNLTYNSRAIINAGADTLFPPIASSEEDYLNIYTHLGVRFKGGLSYDADDNDHIGILISSPLLHIGGSGTVVSDNQINNLKLDSNFTVYFLASTRQTGLKSRWKMPVSLALGYTRDFSRGQIYFSMEYFARIKQYNIITPRNEAFIRPDTANNSATASLLELKDARTSILNSAIGVSYNFNEVVTGYFCLRTDFNYAGKSAYSNDDGFAYNTSTWDQYHSQIGVNLKRRKFNLRAGLLLTYGTTNKYEQPVNFDNPNEGNLLLGNVHETTATRFSAGLMFAYIHNL